MEWMDEYPRPQMRRKNYSILSEGWTLNGLPIRMPFPPQAKASFYEGKIGDILEYEVPIKIEPLIEEERLLLHFGAVDQVADIYLGSEFVGRHEGGYVPFSFDITRYIKTGNNFLRVICEDRLNRDYPYGKQSKKPRGMWYTQVSGIWQNVWIERIPKEGITNLLLHTDMKELEVTAVANASEITMHIMNQEGEEIFTRSFKEKCMVVDFVKENLPIHLWDTQNPYLYGLRLEAGRDVVDSYFALREISVEEGKNGKVLCLNKEPIFLHGVLDQGYFMEGIYLPEDPGEYERDIRRAKKLGFNMLRKHLKVEPETFYYACDKLGMLVMQDMVNNGSYHFVWDTVFPTLGFWHRWDRFPFGKRRKEIFEKHSIAIIDKVKSHPCIVAYTIFNEGWGQFEADRVYELLKKEDKDRLFDSTSGWFVQKKSDFESYHIYFRNKVLKAKERPLILSECGGYTQAIENHLYNPEISYGYGRANNKEALDKMISTMYENMVYPSIEHGMCGCVYTQLCDVETEINGLYTFDRKMCKVSEDNMLKIAYNLQKYYKNQII